MALTIELEHFSPLRPILQELIYKRYYRVEAIVNDVKRGINQGVFREIDSEVAGVMIAGIVDYVSYFIMRGKFKEPCNTINATVDMLVSGLKSDSYIPETGPDSSQQDSAQIDGSGTDPGL